MLNRQSRACKRSWSIHALILASTKVPSPIIDLPAAGRHRTGQSVRSTASHKPAPCNCCIKKRRQGRAGSQTSAARPTPRAPGHRATRASPGSGRLGRAASPSASPGFTSAPSDSQYHPLSIWLCRVQQPAIWAAILSCRATTAPATTRPCQL